MHHFFFMLRSGFGCLPTSRLGWMQYEHVMTRTQQGLSMCKFGLYKEQNYTGNATCTFSASNQSQDGDLDAVVGDQAHPLDPSLSRHRHGGTGHPAAQRQVEHAPCKL